MNKNWAYGFALNHEGAGVGTIYYERAAEIAVQTVRDYQRKTNSRIEVIFNVWKDIDYEIYRGLLG